MQKLIYYSLRIFLIFFALSQTNIVLGQTKKKSRKVYLPEPPPVGKIYIPKVLESITKVDTLIFQKSDLHKLVDKTPIYFIPPKKFSPGSYPIYRFGDAWVEFKFENTDFIREITDTPYLNDSKNIKVLKYSTKTQRIFSKEKNESYISYSLIFGNRSYFVRVRATLPKSLFYLDKELESSILSIGVDEAKFSTDFENENFNLNFEKDNYFIKSSGDSKLRLYKFTHYKDSFKDFNISRIYVNGSLNQFINELGKESSEDFKKVKILFKSENKLEYTYKMYESWLYSKMFYNEKSERIMGSCIIKEENDLKYFQKIFENIF